MLYFTTGKAKKVFSFLRRVVPLNGREEAVSVPITVIKEGEMVKAGSDNLTTSWFNNNLLKVKFIITSYNYE